MLSEIGQYSFPVIRGMRPFRLHVVGDFYSLAYIEKWRLIIKSCPDIQFYGYTRSWRDPELLPALEELRRFPNVQLHASLDWTHKDTPSSDWRLTSIAGTGIPCSYEAKKVDSCMQCGRCFTPQKYGHTSWKLKYGTCVPDELLPLNYSIIQDGAR